MQFLQPVLLRDEGNVLANLHPDNRLAVKHSEQRRIQPAHLWKRSRLLRKLAFKQEHVRVEDDVTIRLREARPSPVDESEPDFLMNLQMCLTAEPTREPLLKRQAFLL